MSDLEAFRSAVEAFLSDHGWTPTRFGKEAAGDPLFVFQLRSGREPRSTTRRKINDFISAFSNEGENGAAAASCHVESATAIPHAEVAR